jgi:hypothetical protein
MMKTMYTYTKLMIVALMAMTAFTSCSSNDEDGYIASTLRNHDWEGTISEYYKSRWGFSGSEYSTVMRFESKDAYYTSGRGYELDCNLSSPRENYAFCSFKWFIVDGDITIIYDDAKWDPVYIIDYELNSNNFYGYIYNGSNSKILFDLQSATFDDWDYYRRKGYRDFTNTYMARELAEPDGISVASGIFAEILKSKE